MSNFSDMVRTTRTVIVDTNISVSISDLFDVLEISDYDVPVKKKGRKKRGVVDVPVLLATGSIISVKLGAKYKGPEALRGKAAFKNSISIVMWMDGKRINFKFSKNGRFQITGNNSNECIFECVRLMWTIISSHPSIYTIDGLRMKATIWTSMENFKTDLGFRLDRQSLNTYVNMNTEHVSVFETSSGSASVNIKMPLEFDDIELTTIEENADGSWSNGAVMYNEFVKNAIGKLTKKTGRYVSFLVFHTGQVIMTSMSQSIMRPYFDEFMRIISDCKEIII